VAHRLVGELSLGGSLALGDFRHVDQAAVEDFGDFEVGIHATQALGVGAGGNHLLEHRAGLLDTVDVHAGATFGTFNADGFAHADCP